jgi:hypothetical protein
MLIFTLISNIFLMRSSVFYTLALTGQLAVYISALIGWRMRTTRRPHPMFYLPFYFTMVNLAAVLAIVKFVSGERQRVWEKAESARGVPAGVPGGPVVTSIRPLVERERTRSRGSIESTEIAGKVAKN